MSMKNIRVLKGWVVLISQESFIYNNDMKSFLLKKMKEKYSYFECDAEVSNFLRNYINYILASHKKVLLDFIVHIRNC